MCQAIGVHLKVRVTTESLGKSTDSIGVNPILRHRYLNQRPHGLQGVIITTLRINDGEHLFYLKHFRKSFSTRVLESVPASHKDLQSKLLSSLLSVIVAL